MELSRLIFVPSLQHSSFQVSLAIETIIFLDPTLYYKYSSLTHLSYPPVCILACLLVLYTCCLQDAAENQRYADAAILV